MSFSDWMAVLAATATVLLLLTAAISDVSRYRIPNKIVYAIAVAFIVSAVFNFAWPAVGWSLLAGVGMFLLGAALFALGLFGGGDVKLIAAMALWTGIADLPRFLLVMTAAGGLLGVVWLVKRRRKATALIGEAPQSSDTSAVASSASAVSPQEEAPSAPKISSRIPYGVAIAIAGLDFFVTSTHSPFTPLWPWLQ